MKTYRAMMADIERLQRQAEVVRRTEIKGVVKHIRELIAEHGLSASDLGLDGGKAPRQFQDLLARAPGGGRKAGKAPKASAGKGVARYQDPATGKTWTGRGKPPNWIAGAKDRTPFEIGAPAAAAAPVKAVKAVKAKRSTQPAAKKAPVNKAAKKRAAPVKAAKASKAAKLPKPPKLKFAQVAKTTRKTAKPQPAPADGSNGAPPATSAE